MISVGDEPCEFCKSPETGPLARTPYGICERCACAICRGFKVFDDRGFLYTGCWPSLLFKNCETCGGSGLRKKED